MAEEVSRKGGGKAAPKAAVSNDKAGHRSRLKERFRKSGLDGFHDYETVELLLTYAIPRRDVKPVAKALVNRFGGLRGVFDATLEELSEVSGVGENAATLVKLIKETAGAYLREGLDRADAIGCSEDVVEYLSFSLSGERVEKFLAIYMNSKNEILGVETLHEGTIDRTHVYPRKAIEKAFKHNARSIIFVHNHPSGDPKPSVSDKKLNDELVKAASAVNILVHDHIIIGRNSFVSGRDLGWFPKR